MDYSFAGAVFFSLFEDAKQIYITQDQARAARDAAAGGGNTYNIGTQSTLSQLNQTGSTTKSIVDEMLAQQRQVRPSLYKSQGEVIKIFVARDVDFSSVYDLRATAAAGRRTPAVDRAVQSMGASDKYVSILAHLRVLEPWLEDVTVNEIAVNRPGTVQLWRRGVWDAVEAPEVDFKYLQALGNFLANISQKPFDETDPILSAYLPGGERIEMTMPPTAPRDMIYLNLRKHTSQSFELEQFVEEGYFAETRHVYSPALSDAERGRWETQLAPAQRALWALAQAGDWPAFLQQSVLACQNLVVSGATGSGKTSFIRALIEIIPTRERLITVEDTPEMPLRNHPNSQALFYRRDGATAGRVVGATAKQVLQAVMRKTPNRVLLAELRGDETFYYVQNVLNSGHPGGITTVHANTPSEAFVRIALLIKASEEGRRLALNEILQLLHTLVHVVVQLEFEAGRGRYVPAIYFDPMHALSVVR